MLVDSPDPDAQGVARGVDLHLPAIDPYVARIGAVDPRQDSHQGGFAGPVLAEQGVHLAAPDVEGDVVIGDDARERLRDSGQLDDRGGGRGGQACNARLLGLEVRRRAHEAAGEATFAAAALIP